MYIDIHTDMLETHIKRSYNVASYHDYVYMYMYMYTGFLSLRETEQKFVYKYIILSS